MSQRQNQVIQPPRQSQQADTTRRGGPGRGSQIIDDSTKNVYGPKTALWTTENDIFLNKPNYRPVDTLLTNYHRWTYVQRFNNFYQDLGNVGTSLNPIFPLMPSAIGASPGYNTYRPYFETEEIKYFNTKSPYTKVQLVWGGDGRALTRVEYSRNINPRWNFGFNYRPLLVDKQVQRTGKGDRQTISHYYDLYSNHLSKDSSYLMLFSYRRIRHRVRENGGIFLDPTDSTYVQYFDVNARPYLSAAESEEMRNELHVYHQYQLAKPFQVYHRLDITRQKNIFRDTYSTEANYYDYFSHTTRGGDIKVDTLSVGDETEFKTIVNEAGIKGNAAFLFYNFYYKVRTYNTFNKYLDETLLSFRNDGVENYIGGRIAFRFDSLSELSGHAEYLLDGNYQLKAELRTPWLDATGYSILAKPGFLPLAYRGSHNAWYNAHFDNTFSNQLSTFLKVKWGRLYLSPGATFTTLTNYIYYRSNTVTGQQTVVPVQSSGNQQVFSPEVRMSLRFFRHFYLRPQVVYTSLLKNDDAAIRIPEWFANVQLAYENRVFNDNLLVQLGVDMHWRSAYTAPSYDPAIQQYYIQDRFVSPAFPLVDIFLNGGFKRGKFFFKYHNLQQAITRSGYMPTLGYRGQGSILDFGFDLILFD